MSYQTCGTCGGGFSGDDDDDDCDECAIGKIQECEDKTGHKKTKKVGKDIVCVGCGIITS